MIKKREPILAGLLSLLAPGLGHIYAGNLRKGLILIGIQYGIFILAGCSSVLSTFIGLACFIGYSICLYIFAFINSAQLAIRNRDYQLQPYNKWYVYLGILMSLIYFANVLVSNREHLFGYYLLQVPSAYMSPALQTGDIITVNTRYRDPQVGDVIIFRWPSNPNILYASRVAALENDTISIKHGVVFRNSGPENKLAVPESNRKMPYSRGMEKRRVPKQQIFVLGDWRDNSKDSRFLGTVPMENIVGKVTYICYSRDSRRIGDAVGSANDNNTPEIR